MSGLAEVTELANERRKRRWAKEKAADKEAVAHRSLIKGIAQWRDVRSEEIYISNVACQKAPADVHCTYVKSRNPLHNPCVFCGGMEEDVF